MSKYAWTKREMIQWLREECGPSAILTPRLVEHWRYYFSTHRGALPPWPQGSQHEAIGQARIDAHNARYAKA